MPFSIKCCLDVNGVDSHHLWNLAHLFLFRIKKSYNKAPWTCKMPTKALVKGLLVIMQHQYVEEQELTTVPLRSTLRFSDWPDHGSNSTFTPVLHNSYISLLFKNLFIQLECEQLNFHISPRKNLYLTFALSECPLLKPSVVDFSMRESILWTCVPLKLFYI